MNGTTLERPDVAAYLDAVRSRLSDLPAEERDDLVADVEASLLESGEPPALSPQEFAMELREAAGLSRRSRSTAPPSALDALRAWLSSERAAAWRRKAVELAPVWWIARAFVAVFAASSSSSTGTRGGRDRRRGLVRLDRLALVAASVLSIWLGLRGRRDHGPGRRVVLTVNVALALALLPAAVVTLDQLESSAVSYVYTEPTSGLALDGVQIRNVYPYSRDGKLLFDVLLYDESGHPIDVLSGPEDAARRLLTDANGTHVFNSFPVRYYEPGTTTVARPALAPASRDPRHVTPPLARPK